MLKRFCMLLSCLLMTTLLCAQSSPSGERGGVTVWVGGGFSTFNPDYGCTGSSPFSCSGGLLQGINTFADFNHLFFTRLGAEGQAKFLHWGGLPGLSEDSYLVGPRFNLWRHRSLVVEAKLLVGNGHINLPDHGPGEGNHFVYAPGVGADFRLSPRWAARVEYEYQAWPGFTGQATSFTSGTGGIRPNGFSFGVSYAVLR
jgi:opacity protein-like surface antigen